MYMKEYIITRTFDHLKPPLLEGTIVSHIEIIEDESMFRFYRHDTQSNSKLHYNWAFVENTKKNRKLIKKRNKLENKQYKITKKIDKVVNEFMTLPSWEEIKNNKEEIQWRI